MVEYYTLAGYTYCIYPKSQVMDTFPEIQNITSETVLHMNADVRADGLTVKVGWILKYNIWWKLAFKIQ